MKINIMKLYSIGIFFILIMSVCSFSVIAAFFEETLEGTATNISDNFIYIDDNKVNLPVFVIENINEGDSVIFGSPEPLLIVYKDDKISYGYGNIFHFSDSIQFTNGITVQRLKTKKLRSSNSESMTNVTTYFRVMKAGDTKDFALDPGEYTVIMDTVIAVHRAEVPVAPIEGPQHWYVYEIQPDKKKFSNYKGLDFVNTELRQKKILGLLLFLSIFLIISYHFLKQRV